MTESPKVREIFSTKMWFFRTHGLLTFPTSKSDLVKNTETESVFLQKSEQILFKIFKRSIKARSGLAGTITRRIFTIGNRINDSYEKGSAESIPGSGVGQFFLGNDLCGSAGRRTTNAGAICSGHTAVPFRVDPGGFLCTTGL